MLFVIVFIVGVFTGGYLEYAYGARAVAEAKAAEAKAEAVKKAL